MNLATAGRGLWHEGLAAGLVILTEHLFANGPIPGRTSPVGRSVRPLPR